LNAKEQIAKLESLLGRIQRRAAEPRPAQASANGPAPSTPFAHTTPAASAPPLDIDETGSAELEELDMMDAEIVEIDAVLASPPGQATEIDLTGMEDEPVPESAPRAAHGHTDETDREPPVKTPPPESGRQVMAPVQGGPTVTYQEGADEVDLSGAGDVDALLEADHSGGPISKAPPGKPTMEQLGETVELEGADGPAAELELLMPAPEHEPEPDELEASLPRREFSGGYDPALAPPAGAHVDLERHRRDEGRTASGPESHSLSEPMSAMPPTEVAPGPPPGPPAVAKPLVVERPQTSAVHAAEIVVAKPARLPETFLDLLDGSLRL
jgi:hypothetical protein